LSLHVSGWKVAERYRAIPPVLPGGPREFSQALSKPVAYFACLNDIDDVFAKGVVSVGHAQKSGYYRCLLLLSGDRLASALAIEDLEEKDYKLLLQDVTDPDPDCEPPALEDLPEGFRGDALPIWPAEGHAIKEEKSSRSIVRCPGFDDLKVYFDHLSGSSAIQQGFAVCNDCGVCRWKTTNKADARAYFATMLAWQRGCQRSGGTRIMHRPWVVPDADVTEALQSMTLEEF